MWLETQHGFGSRREKPIRHRTRSEILIRSRKLVVMIATIFAVTALSSVSLWAQFDRNSRAR